MDDSSADSDATIRAYLLDELTDDESEAIAERFFVDPALFERVEAGVDDLCHEYVMGRLSRAERARVEALAKVGRGPNRLRFAEALSRELQSHAQRLVLEPIAAPRISPGSNAPLRRAWRKRTTLRVAAAFVLAALGWPALYFESAASNARVASIRRSTAQEIADVRRAAAERQSDSKTVDVALYPSVRGATDRAIIVPNSALYVRLQLLTETPLASGRYVLTLRQNGHETGSAALTVPPGASDSVPTVRLPAPQLPVGDVQVIVGPLDDKGGAPSRTHDFAIRVVRP